MHAFVHALNLKRNIQRKKHSYKYDKQNLVEQHSEKETAMINRI